MGSGKSTVGQMLAQKLDRFLLDTDQLIEKREGMGIREIFEQKGEAYFRGVEQSCLEWMTKNIRNSIIATGGGFPIHTMGIEKLGRVVFLDSTFDVLRRRIESDQKNQRPLAEKIDHAEKIFETRHQEYSRLSNLTIDADNKTASIVEEILKSLFGDGTR